MMKIDTEYRVTYRPGYDPDAKDLILHNHHLALWNKTLPNGKSFNLRSNGQKPYKLLHDSDLGHFELSSDSIIHSYKYVKRMEPVINAMPKGYVDAFFDTACSIGGYIIFPSNKVNEKQTINVERGINRLIWDRFDLTLECIRRWYAGEESPLYACLDRYKNFFQLFGSFSGYVKFFLLEDLVNEDMTAVRFWLPFKEFDITSTLPKNVNEYSQYSKNSSDFTIARNKRMKDWATL